MVDSPLSLALAHHQAGRLETAAAAYLAHLAGHPADSEAKHLLGVLRHQQGRPAAGRELVEAAILLAPDVAAYHANLGLILSAVGDAAAAVAAYDRATTLDPALAAPLRTPLAQALLAGAQFARAMSVYLEIASNEPANAEAWRGAALSCHSLGDAAGAIPAYRRAVALAPDDIVARNGLGAALLDTGAADEALAVLELAAKQSSRPFGPLLANLGNARRANGDTKGAIAAMRAAAECEPGNATTLANLAAALSEDGALGEAADLSRRALAIAPHDSAARTNLGACLFDSGDIAEAIALWKGTPDDRHAGSNALYAMNFMPSVTDAAMRAAAGAWARAHAPAALAAGAASFANTRDPHRKLRIGLVSPDLRSHSVAWFLLPVLEALDTHAVEIHAFAELPVEDPITARIKAHVAGWHPTAGIDDEAMVRTIRAARIDVLLDLAGHTAGNRLGAFARRAAPVQASWLGYPAVSGVEAIDWRVTDAIVDPPDPAGPPDGAERPLRLPSGFHAYRLPDGAPDVVPRDGAGTVFGSFNNWPKHSPECLAAWAEILGRVPDARLILKNKAMADPATRKRVLDSFVARGIAAARIELLTRVPDPRGHLGLYGLVDVALDPFPYNGVTTTCEAIAMGVPVVALQGTTQAGRVGAALLARIGCPELVASSIETYIGAAVELAGNRTRRVAYRAELRRHLLTSPVGDPAGIARDLVEALRFTWRSWCAANPAG
ncbi:MAG: tetratricopeptide repeat protein [Proteobacteria bacterium]|nr:tetratricopeptide repeat protein [Pseudomonadota bacterium]